MEGNRLWLDNVSGGNYGIDTSLYEAAAIDGANVFQRIFWVTIPMIMPTTIILLLLSVGGIFKGNFDMFYNLVGLYDKDYILF